MRYALKNTRTEMYVSDDMNGIGIGAVKASTVADAKTWGKLTDLMALVTTRSRKFSHNMEWDKYKVILTDGVKEIELP